MKKKVLAVMLVAVMCLGRAAGASKEEPKKEEPKKEAESKDSGKD